MILCGSGDPGDPGSVNRADQLVAGSPVLRVYQGRMNTSGDKRTPTVTSPPWNLLLVAPGDRGVPPEPPGEPPGDHWGHFGAGMGA